MTRLRDVIKTTCVQGNAASTDKGEAARDAERGNDRNAGSGGLGLSFGEGVARLSLTFAVYIVFLAFLLGLRRHLKAAAIEPENAQRRDPAGSVPPDLVHFTEAGKPLVDRAKSMSSQH